MDNKTPDEKNKKQKRSPLWVLLSPFLSPEESAAVMVYYFGCFGVIILVTFFIRWLVGIFK